MKKESKSLSDERRKLLKYLIEQFGEKSLIPQDIFRFVTKQDKEFIKKSFEDMEKRLIGNKIKYQDVVLIIKKRAGEKLI